MVPSYFAIPISCYSSIVGMSWHSTRYGIVTTLADIGTRSLSGSISSMCGASVYPASTLVVSSSPIGWLLWSRNSILLVWPCPSAFTRAIMVLSIGVTSQLCFAPFLMDPRVINLNPPCLFSLGTIQISPLVWGLVLLRGVSYFCIWQYWPKGMARCLL